jgi:hypothetical protein
MSHNEEIYPIPDRSRPHSRHLISALLTKSAKPLTTSVGQYISNMVAMVSTSRIEVTIQHLASYSTRYTFSSNIVLVREWIYKQFVDLGYSDVLYYEYDLDGSSQKNIVCIKPGKGQSNAIIILCAHYDSIALKTPGWNWQTDPAPGANDNATGIAAILEIARILKDIETYYTICFIAFSGEEQGLKGSTAYAQYAQTNGMKILLLINLDEIGYPDVKPAWNIIVEEDQGNHTSTNDAASHECALAMAQAAADFTSLASKYTNIWASDYMPFEWRGYVVVGAYQSGNDPYYHTIADIPSHVDMEYVAEVTKMILATTIKLAGLHTGSGLVFDPDPITTSGDENLSNSSPKDLLEAQRKAITLQNLKPPTANGMYNLNGLYANVTDIEIPHVPPPTNSIGEFRFSYLDDGFKDVMAYYHIDSFQRYIQSLGFSNIVSLPLHVDAHGQKSQYNSLTKAMILAEESITNPSAAEDASLILHYYGQAILDDQNPGFNYLGGLGIGFGDFLGAVFFDDRHANPAATRGLISPWYNGHASHRRYDRPWKFGGPEAVDDYAKGEIWASVMFEIYRKLGGDSSKLIDKHNARDLTIKLHLDANFVVQSTATETQMGLEILKADLALQGWHDHFGGLHSKVIYEAFHSRILDGFNDNLTLTSDVDVYINDGRKGKYDWLEDPWHPKDIWTRLKKDGNLPGNDVHQKPIQDKPAYLYAKVRNLGTEIAKIVTVKAYSSAMNIGQIWPNDFIPMKPKAIVLLGLLPDSSNPKGSIVGPFEWISTATSGESVLIILECDQDQSLTQFIADNVSTIHLARFDNNIAQRNLMPE